MARKISSGQRERSGDWPDLPRRTSRGSKAHIDRRLSIRPSDEEHDGAPWTQWEGETDEWFFRFQRFLYLGPGRHHKYIYYEDRKAIERKQYLELTDGKPGTLAVQPSESKKIPRYWNDHVTEFAWVNRAQAWDEYQLAKEKVLYEEERRAYREIRLKHLDEAGEIIKKYIEHAKDIQITSQPSLRQLMSALNTYAELTRKEFGEDKDGPLVAIDARKQIIERIEVVKDYGEA